MDSVVKRIDDYDDERFSKKVLAQHGAFLVSDLYPYEVEIISKDTALVRGKPEKYYERVIEAFRFYAENISCFYDEKNQLIKNYEEVDLFYLPLSQIQPSQFVVSERKKQVLQPFIHSVEDVVIPVVKHEGIYISLDGHTRLSLALDLGLKKVKAFHSTSDEDLYAFVQEAQKRGVKTVFDMKVVSHEEYTQVWDHFCDEFFSQRQNVQKK